MGKKRKQEDSEEKIRRKIKKYSDKLEGKLQARRRIIYSSDEDDIQIAEPGDPVFEAAQMPCGVSEQSLTLPAATPCVEDVEPDLVTMEELPAAVAEASMSADVTEVELDHDILELLGEAPAPESTLGKAIHKDVAARWVEILKKGLAKETKEKLSNDYLIPSNCELLVPPILNAEAKAALTDPFVKRDASLAYRQKQISNALAALAPVIDVIISKQCDQGLRNQLLKPVSDACRILCDMHYNETKIRKKFVISSISSSLKDTLVSASTDKYLFGENMTEKIKTAKSVQRSGEALKIPAKVQKSTFTRSFNGNQSNYKPLHHKTAGKDAGRNQPAPRQRGGRAGPARRGAAAPPPRDRSPPAPRSPSSRRRTNRH